MAEDTVSRAHGSIAALHKTGIILVIVSGQSWE
jgi:hypothetical protein